MKNCLSGYASSTIVPHPLKFGLICSMRRTTCANNDCRVLCAYLIQ